MVGKRRAEMGLHEVAETTRSPAAIVDLIRLSYVHRLHAALRGSPDMARVLSAVHRALDAWPDAKGIGVDDAQAWVRAALADVVSRTAAMTPPRCG
ncbi:MAG: hypothetical protein AB1778_00810 [Candidatus Bipolaricaulota bacterium]